MKINYATRQLGSFINPRLACWECVAFWILNNFFLPYECGQTHNLNILMVTQSFENILEPSTILLPVSFKFKYFYHNKFIFVFSLSQAQLSHRDVHISNGEEPYLRMWLFLKLSNSPKPNFVVLPLCCVTLSE